MFNKGNDVLSANKIRKIMFCKKNQSVDKIPPTQNRHNTMFVGGYYKLGYGPLV